MQALPKENRENRLVINTINYYLVIPCIVIGTLLLILLGRNYFSQAIADNNFFPSALTKIDRAIFDHHQSIQQILVR